MLNQIIWLVYHYSTIISIIICDQYNVEFIMLRATRKLLFAIFCIIWNFKIHQRLINPGTKLFIEIIICLPLNEVIFHLNASGVIIRRVVFYRAPNTRYILLFRGQKFFSWCPPPPGVLGDALQELHYAWCKLVSIYRKTRGKLLKAKLPSISPGRSYCATALTNSNPAP